MKIQGDFNNELSPGSEEIAALDAAFRGPLSEIFADLSVVRRRLREAGDTSLDPYLDSISLNAYRILRDCGDAARLYRAYSLELPERGPVRFWDEMSELCDACLAVVSPSGIRFDYFFPEQSDACVSCHFVSIAQAAVCLINSACLNSSGSVCVTGQLLPGRVMVTVTDDGPARDESELERLFISNRDGLSLPTAKQVIYSHGGVLAISAPPSGGAAVSFTLPTCDCPTAELLPLESGSGKYLEDRFSLVHVGLCDVVPPQSL